MTSEEDVRHVMHVLSALPKDHQTPVAVAILSATAPDRWREVAETAVDWWQTGEWHVDPEAPSWLRATQLADTVRVLLTT